MVTDRCGVKALGPRGPLWVATERQRAYPVSMRIHERISRIPSILAIVSMLVLPLAAAQPATADDGKAYRVGVEGMVCPSGCTSSVQEALETVDGVEAVKVSFPDKAATVQMAPGKTLSADNCDQAFGNSGYFVSSFDEEGSDAADESGT